MKLRALMLLPIAAAVLAAGCGEKTNKGAKATQPGVTGKAPAASSYQLTADSSGKLSFDKSEIDAPAGAVRLDLSNPSSEQHNIAIKGNGVDKKGPVVGKDGRSSVTVALKPGTYEFYCSVDGHEAAGMKGKLVVGNAGSTG
jgi:plastocyanin